VQTLLHALVIFRLLPNGFPNADLRADRGLRVALFFTRAYDRLLRPGLSSASSPAVVRNGAHQLTEDER